MNEMIAMPSVVLLIIGTAFLSAVVTTVLPSLPNYWNALKSSIKRVFTHESDMDVVDVILIAQLQEQMDKTRDTLKYLIQKNKDIEEQVNNLVEVKYNRETNRKNNIRREVRDYLKELQK